MAAKKKATPKKKSPVKKKSVSKPKKETKAKVTKSSSKSVAPDFAALDRKALAGRARELKKELLAIRFNLQSPSLADYRKKKKELAKVLNHLS